MCKCHWCNITFPGTSAIKSLSFLLGTRYMHINSDIKAIGNLKISRYKGFQLPKYAKKGLIK